MFFRLSSWALGLILFAIVFGVTIGGLLLGRRLRHRSETLREPFAILQTSLLGVVGLLLAFGLALAVGRYEARRAAVVDEANAIDTTYLRAQTLPEPMRTRSLDLLASYLDTSIALSNAIPGSPEAGQAVADEDRIQRALWALAGRALVIAPIESAPRLYVETLNEMIEMQTVRVAGLANRVPGPVLALEVAGAAIAFGMLAVYLSMLGRRGISQWCWAPHSCTMLLLVTFDLDRPTRGLIRVPADPLTSLSREMQLPPRRPDPHSR